MVYPHSIFKCHSHLSVYTPITSGFYSLPTICYCATEVLAINAAPSEVLLNKIQYPPSPHLDNHESEKYHAIRLLNAKGPPLELS